MGGTKHDNGKPRMSLIPHDAMVAVAEVLTFGAKKYDSWNWAKGFKYSRLLDAAYRHLGAWKEGETKDPESGLSHLAHAACCIVFLIVHERRGLGENDNYAWPVDSTNSNTNDKSPEDGPDLSSLGPDCKGW